MSWLRLLRRRPLGKQWSQNLRGGAFLKGAFLLHRHWRKSLQFTADYILWLRDHSLTPRDTPTQLPAGGATYQEGQLGLVSALNAFCVKFALLKAAVHDVHGTCHPPLDVLKGGGWEAHPQLVTQNVPGGQNGIQGLMGTQRSIWTSGQRDQRAPQHFWGNHQSLRPLEETLGS